MKSQANGHANKMNSPYVTKDPARLLEGLGIEPAEQAAYRLLLRQPGLCLHELARQLGVTPRRATRLMTQLEQKGLVTYTPTKIKRYQPTPPDIAVEALILRRQQELQQTRLVIGNLQEEMHRSAASAQHEDEIVQIVSGPAAQQAYQKMQRAAKDEILCLIRPPFLVSSPNRVDELRVEAAARGVRFRNIYDAQVLEIPGWLNEIQRGIRAGEEVRIHPALPGKLVIHDRTQGLLPLDLKQPDGPVLMVQPSSLLDALCELFELMWEMSTPISFERRGNLVAQEAIGEDADGQRLVALLASGLNDKAIGLELGISPRTLHRRLSDLQDSLHARTRFQAGWQAALRYAELLKSLAGTPARD